MRTLAIDLGARRVGLAISDEGGRFATPLEVLQVTDPQQAVAPILKIINDEDVERIVLGLPINMDGSSGPAAQQVIAWSKGLAPSNVRVIFVDERLSTFAAEQSLNERKRAGEKLTKKRRKEQLDAVAAAGFLQAFLDGRLMPIDEGH
jgi:putative Holliday junction resolvase